MTIGAIDTKDSLSKAESESYCPFCNGVQIDSEYIGRGTMTFNTLVGSFFGSEDINKTETECSNGIILKRGNILLFDNSSQEYAALGVKIRYCPFCGRELKEGEGI